MQCPCCCAIFTREGDYDGLRSGFCDKCRAYHRREHVDSSDKNPSGFYDEAYLHTCLTHEAHSATRWEDNGLFYQAAVTVADLMRHTGAREMLDVGCGRGWKVHHVRNMGLSADGIEYGEAPLKYSVCGARRGDLTETLPVADDAYGLVICHGVLSHLMPDAVVHALSELRRVCKLGGHLWTNILVKWHETQQHHKIFAEPWWWRERFATAGWQEAVKFEQFLRDHGTNASAAQWGAVWVK